MEEKADSESVVVLTDKPDGTMVVRGEVSVRFNAGNAIEIHGDGPVTLHSPANDPDAHRTAALQVGDVMDDRTIFAGISPDTGRPMFALPCDASLTMTWHDAATYAGSLAWREHPRGTFRLPTKNELKVIFEHRAQIGGFNETGSPDERLYWSSSDELVGSHHNEKVLWTQLFHPSSGRGGWRVASEKGSVRLIKN